MSSFGGKSTRSSIASSIAQAEALITRETFDLIMLDVRLPDGDGQQFLERVGAMPDRPLVVMMTGPWHDRKRGRLHARRRFLTI